MNVRSVWFLGLWALAAHAVAAQYDSGQLVAIANLTAANSDSFNDTEYLNVSNIACFGTLVSGSYVLTSATCAESVIVGNVVITTDVNMTNISEDLKSQSSVKKIIPYGNTAINNVALLQLTKNVTFTGKTVWRQNRTSLGTVCFRPADYPDTDMTNENRTITACNEEVLNSAHICAKSETLLEDHEGSILVCDDLVAGIYSAILNPDNTMLVKYQEISIYSQWITKIINAASYVNMSFTAFLIMAVIVAATAF